VEQFPVNSAAPSEGAAAAAEASLARRLGYAAVLLSAGVLLSRILGFLRDVIIAAYYGDGPSAEAYVASFTLPDLLGHFIAGGALSITFIPMFSAYVSRNDEEGGWRLFSTIATTMGALMIAFCVVGELFAGPIVAWLTPELDPNTLALAVTMTRIVIPAQLAFYIGGLLQSTLFVREVFWPAAVTPLIYNAGIIVFGVALEPLCGVQSFSWGVLIGAYAGPLLLPLWAARHRVRYTPRFDVADPGFREFILLSLPLMLGVSLLSADEWLYKYFGSADEGAIARLMYARKLMLLAFAMLGQATGQAVLPYLTRLYQEGKHDAMGRMLALSGRQLAFFSIVATAGIVALARPAVDVVYLRGAFTVENAHDTSVYLVFFGLGLAAWSLQTVFVRGFYARKDTLTPMAIGTAVFILSIFLYGGLFERFGPTGLAAASSVGITLNAAATLVVYRRRSGALPVAPIAAGALRGLALALPSGLAAHAVVRALVGMPLGASLGARILYLAAGALAFAVVAALMTLLVRPPELLDFLVRIRDRFSRRAPA
jgi:putative peptidoglycan lipid II flippase